MSLSDCYRGRFYRALARNAPSFAVRIAEVVARYESRRDTTGGNATLVNNLARAFPTLPADDLQRMALRFRVSQYKTGALLSHLSQCDAADIRRYVDRHVGLSNEDAVGAIAQHDGPVVLVTPHYGAFLAASLKLIQEIGHAKRFNLFFDDPAKNPSTREYAPIYERFGGNAEVLYNGRRGVVAALKALKRGEILTMMPDVFEFGDNHLVVPFLGRLTHAMSGTAFFAAKSRALVVPVYGAPATNLNCTVSVGQPIAFREHHDFEQTLYELTAAIFANIESRIRCEPEHWVYWPEFERRIASRAIVPSGIDAGWESTLRELLDELRAQSPSLGAALDAVAACTLQECDGLAV